MTTPREQPVATGLHCKPCGGRFYRYSYGLQCHGCGYGPGGEVPGPKRKGHKKKLETQQRLVFGAGRITKRIEAERRGQS